MVTVRLVRETEVHRDLYDIIPYSYGILEPGEWYWFTYQYPPQKEKSQRESVPDQDETGRIGPAIRVTFRARPPSRR